ncbi:MAG: BrnT family toxin [Candidatus Hydrogenedentes bacterium]|nr:BrnT family toxin [Candidatus Hydrogenedentota bacterium]
MFRHFEHAFDWDARKDLLNIAKHGIGFERASTVFLDPNAISVYDEMHSQMEDRWVTLGMDRSGIVLAVAHTFVQDFGTKGLVRLISARKATPKEVREYGIGR